MRVVKPSEFHKYPAGTLYFHRPSISLDVKINKTKGVQNFIPHPDRVQALEWICSGDPEYFKGHYTCDLTKQSYPENSHRHSKEQDQCCRYTGTADYYLVFDLEELQYMKRLLDKAIKAAEQYEKLPDLGCVNSTAQSED